MSAGASRAPRLPGGARLAPLWIAAALFAALAAAGATRTGRLLELRGLDLLTRLAAPGASRLPITIVGIDEPSFAELDLQWPWPRGLHAELLERLTAAGAAVVAFDVLFAEPSDPLQDARLAEVAGAAGTAVLASDLVFRETRHARQWLRVDPLPELREAGARWGLAGVELDADAVVRRVPLYRDAFWREVLRRFGETRPGLAPEAAEPPPGALIRWLGPDHTFPYVSYYQALDPERYLPPGALQDQIVLVGRDVRATPEAGAAQADTFATPFTAATGWLTPGVEVHATILENVVSGTTVRPLPRAAALGLLAAALGAGLLAMRRWRPLPAAAGGLAVAAAVAAADWLIFLRLGAWLPAGAALLAVPLLYVGLGGSAYLSERRQRARIKAAFGRYLSPAVMEQVLANPGGLSLGGERRDLTVLFTDLQGFTALSERLGPEEVARLLNRHLTAVTRVVLAEGGTVDKFIGDAVMAFWGAPLPDERQAEHAVAAAAGMCRAMDALRAELAREGLPELRMRVGVHSGPAVVGNMGSEERFEYTAVGDTVNLASRLEGANKVYGTELLISGDTAARLPDRGRLRPVDRVCVKGRREPVEIFTLCDREGVPEASGAALAACRCRDWGRAEALWREVLAADPDDGVARVHLERIVSYRRRPPPEDWDGAARLEKG